MPKLTKDIYAVRPGRVYPEVIPAGEDVPETLIEAAKALGALGRNKATKAPETKG